MEKKENILVCYATRYGSTEEVAGIIAETLTGQGCNVTLASLLDEIDLSGIDIVFIGSPLHLGKWLPEAKEFLQLKKSVLKNIPVFTFTTGITLSEPTEHNLLKAKFAIDEILVYVEPVDSGFFAGKLSSERLSEPDRQLIKMAGIKDADYIDAGEIEKWTADTCKKYILK